MRVLIALLLLAANVGAQEFDWAFDDPFAWKIGGDPASLSKDSTVPGTDSGSSAGQVSETPALESFVHRINVANRGGSCMFLTPTIAITCKHLFEGLRGYQVSIDGTAVEASVTLAPAHDVAIVVIGNGASTAPTVKFDREPPAYLSECVAFGFGSETVHRGFISNDDTLSLTSDGGIEQGDSGGAVFCNGTLVGVIRGKNPANPRVCYFTPLESVAALVAPFTPDSSRNAGEPAADDKPKIRINIADFPCPPCETLKGYAWDEFDVEWVTGGAESYPQISWLDSRGVRRVLTGAYTPWQVNWSWKATQ